MSCLDSFFFYLGLGFQEGNMLRVWISFVLYVL